MCGIGLIVSGVVLGGHRFCSAEAPPPQATNKASGTDLPDIEDLCGQLKRRGPDHIGGVSLHIWPSWQHLETWESHSGSVVKKGVGSILRSAHGTIPPGFKENEGGQGSQACVVASLANKRTGQAFQSESSSCAVLDFIGATLQLRGDKSVIQPLKDSRGNLLVYNGEVFGGLLVRGNENDSMILMEALANCCGCACHSSQRVSECQCPDIEPHQSIPQILSRLRGPWALIYWQAVSQTLWFGRDAIGRRSLLVHEPSAEDARFLLTSVSPDLSNNTARGSNYWKELNCGIYSISYSLINDNGFKDELPRRSSPSPNALSVIETSQGCALESLRGWTRLHSWEDLRLQSLLAWERHRVNPSNDSSSHGLWNLELCAGDVDCLALHDEQMANRNGMDGNNQSAHNTGVQSGNQKSAEGQYNPVQKVLWALQQAVKKRTSNIRRHGGTYNLSELESRSTESSVAVQTSTPVAVLFSGGLDSMILAALADQFVDSDCSIDLLNVSFDGESAPDRITAKTGVAELREVFPLRRWRLIEINAGLSDISEYRRHLEALISPSDTYMDLNIGIALWVAASGEGHLHEPAISDPKNVRNHAKDTASASYTCRQEPELGRSQGLEPSTMSRASHVHSEARVLLVGSGADEQCGGYGRHRTKFRLGGWECLEAEMRLDFTRIWKRNLGRDDRCIADRGKEARFPFLDEDVISTLLSLPLWEVVDLQQPVGIGDKMILRKVAQLLGLRRAASLPKRAIQFGSRVAQESNRKDFGSNRAANQASAGSALFKRTADS